MFGQEDNDRPAGSGARKAYLRSVSWSDRSPSKPNPRPQPNTKGRPCLPPLQPLSICRRNVEEWPRAGSDDLGVWPHPPTPGAIAGPAKPLKNSDSEQPLREFQFKKDKLAFFDKECSRIADHIYLGSDAVAKNREILRKNGITHVLNCVGFVCPEYFKSDLVYKTLWLQDSLSEDITSILYDVFDYFEDVRDHGGRVLVHCCQGVSRSTSLVIAYLMWREGQSFEDAFQYVKGARGVTNPNMGFASQLLQCQKRVLPLPSSPNSVPRMYRMAPHSSYDPLHLVPKMLGHPSAIGLDSRGAFIVHVSSALYVWIGKRCNTVMSSNAKAAASQVIRYERVQGPAVTINEGEEPSEFWGALASGQILSDSCEKGVEKDEQSLSSRKVDEYDLDFELFSKALAGGVVPPVSLSGAEFETSLPARENGWERLRRRLANGKMKELVMSSKLNHGTTQTNCASNMIVDSPDKVENPALPTDPVLPSILSSDSLSGLPNSALDSSKSLTLSPSTSDYSSSFNFSPSSSNWSDQSFQSSQTSPSSLDSVDLVSSRKASLAENEFSICTPNPPSSTVEAYPAYNACKGTLPSIAERRGSNPPLQMLVPSVDEASQIHRNVARSWSFSLPDLHDASMEDVEYDQSEEEDFHELNREEPMLGASSFSTCSKLQTGTEDKLTQDLYE